MSGTMVVTGAARGIGRAIAERLADECERLVLVDLAPEVASVAESIRRRGTAAEAVPADLRQESGVAAVASVGGGAVTALVNNAGITRDARLVNMSDDDFTDVLEVNLGVAYRLTEAVGPSIVDGGSVVNIASRSYLGNFGQYNYSVSKGGMIGLTRAMAIELAPRVRCNAVAPGLVGTEMSMAIPQEVRTRMVESIPLGRMGEPAEVAELVAFLASDRASYITGHVAIIGGGRSLT